MIKPSKSILLLCLSGLAGLALACSLSGQAAPTAPPATETTEAIEPTAAPTAAEQATLAPTAGPGGPAAGYQLVTAPTDGGDRLGWYAALVLDGENDPIIAYLSSDPNGDGDAADSVVQVASWNRAEGAWRAPVNVATVGEISPGQPANQLSLARDAGTGALGLAYAAQISSELWLAHSEDGGLTWSTEQVQLPGEGHNFMGPVLALANGTTHLAVADSSYGSTYLSRTVGSGIFNVAPLPTLGDDSVRFAQPGLAVDSAGNPALAYWLNSNENSGPVLDYWRPGEPEPARITDTGDNQNDVPFVALAFAGQRPAVALAAIFGYDPATNDTTGDVWTVTQTDGGAWGSPVLVPRDGGQSMAGPLTVAVSPSGEGAIIPWIAGGNLEGTVCGRPKLARSADWSTWVICSPDPSEDTNVNTGYVGAAFGTDGKLSLVMQNGATETLPAGLYFWREP